MLYPMWRFVCGECGKVRDFPMPLPPYGWREVDGKFICGNHKAVDERIVQDGRMENRKEV